jgi:hypothetical protein
MSSLFAPTLFRRWMHAFTGLGTRDERRVYERYGYFRHDVVYHQTGVAEWFKAVDLSCSS